MRHVTLIGRYRVHKRGRRWIVVRTHSHGEACVSTHGSYATACGAAKRYDESDQLRHRDWQETVRRFV